MKKILALFLSLTVLLLLAACGTTKQGGEEGSAEGYTGDRTLIVRTSTDPLNFVPSAEPDDGNYAMVQNIYSRLTKLDASKNIIPDLASSWETSDDGLVITFHLRDDVTWHDGEKFTSTDVKYTFDVISESPTYSAYSAFDSVESIETPDDYTVELHLTTPNVAVISILGWYGTFIMPEHIFNNGEAWADNPAANNPVGTGPFKFVSYEPGVSITVEKNPDYFQNEVWLDKVTWTIIPDDSTAVQSLLNGEIDILESVPNDELDNLRAAGIILEENEYPSPLYLAFNFMPGEYTTDYAVRLAIAQCINREEICEKVFNNVRSPEYNFYPSLIEWATNSDAPAPSYSIEGAIETLEEAGYTKDSDGYYIREYELISYPDGGTSDVAELIVASCKEAGIEIVYTPIEYQAWAAIVWQNMLTEGGNFRSSLMGGFQGPDPASLRARIGTGNNNNIGQYSNARIDELFQQALVSSDQSVRAPLYKEIQKIMSEELPIIPIVNYAGYDAQGPNVMDSPIQCTGKAGWQEYSYTYFV